MKLKRLVITFVSFLSLWMVTGCSNGEVQAEKENTDFPPSMTGRIHVDETEYEMEAGGYRWERKKGSEVEVVQTDAASPNQIAEEFEAIQVEPKSPIDIEVEGDPDISVYLWNTDGKEKAVPIHNNELSAPSDAGQYIYEVLAEWTNGEVSYTFVLEVK